MTSIEEEKDTESIPLFNYLRQHIPIEDIRDYASPKRIVSIDAVKGFAIIFIMLAHTAGVWLDQDWIYLFGMIFAVLDILGPSLFIFLSALSVIFSIKRKQGVLPDKVIRARIFSRGIMIMLLGVLYNVISLPNVPFPLNLWGWNILMFIGFSQICAFYALKIKQPERIFIGLIVIATAPTLREVLYLNKDSNIFAWIFHFIITSPAPHVTLVPWIGIIFISTIFGEWLYTAMEVGSKEEYIYLCRRFLFYGFFMVLIGIFLGCKLQTPETMPLEEYPHLYLYNIMNQQNYYKFAGMPEFLIRGTISNQFYNLGAALIIIAIFFHILDIKKKWNNFYSMLVYYGKVSLSLFLIHYIFLTLYVNQYNIVFFPFVEFAFLAFMGFFIYIWFEYFEGKGSPEYIMIQVGRIGQKTGEKVKEELKKTEKIIKKEFQKIKKKENNKKESN
ncbi:MAG: heparan-alpha-glucosaminide N-acetyltransferase domain-containing protein [Promethearchaeia archaeon]